MDEAELTIKESARAGYIAWLKISVPGWLVPGNIEAFTYALRDLPKETAIVEIGSFCGLSTCVLSYIIAKFGLTTVPFYTCDTWAFESLLWLADDQPFFDSTVLRHGDFKSFVRASFQRNVLTFCQPDPPHSFELDSDSFFLHWSSRRELTDVFGQMTRLGGRSIGFCYIDGNHTYPFARHDFENADRYLAPRGYILFDDSGTNDWPDVARVAQEVKASGRYELVSANPHHLFRKRA